RGTPPPNPSASSGDELARAILGDRYGDVVALCTANAKLASQNLAGCLIAACHLHDAAKAKHWIAQVPAGERSQLTAACSDAGTPLDAPRPPAKPSQPDCDVNPLDCRR